MQLDPLSLCMLISISHYVYPYDIRTHKNYASLPNDECGENQDDRIIGGSMATMGQYPWMAVIGYALRKCESKLDFRCGGSLITKKHVITAAHCITHLPQSLCKKTNKHQDYFPKVVRLGEHNIKTNPDCENNVCADPVQNILIESMIYHHNYNNPKLRNDIGIIKLKSDAIFNAWVSPLCLISDGNLLTKYMNLTGIVAGWGIIDIYTRERSDILMKLQVSLVKFDDCSPHYESIVTLSPERQICAGGIRNQDSCSGDSGGPLAVVTETDEGPRYSLLGVISFGFKRCASKPVPAIYTNVIYYGKWILDNF